LIRSDPECAGFVEWRGQDDALPSRYPNKEQFLFMHQINLEAVDTDGAVREAAEEVSGDTRLSFLRKGAVAGGAALGGGAILSAVIPGTAFAKGAPPGQAVRQG
jgi:hypothetical protein